nr:reverse transcriptase domain-containing protein [Tanacetum cinerariifolium]
MAANGNGDDGPPAGGGDLPVPDLRTMEELCQPTLNGRGGPIAPIAIQATNFELKNDMIQQVQNSCQFHRLSGDDANKHHDKFLHDTSAQKSESSSSITSSCDPEIVALEAEMAEINKNLMKVLQIIQQVKAITPSCETCGGPHAYNDCLANVGQTQNVFAARAYNQGGASDVQNLPPAYQAPICQASGYQALVQQAPIPQPQVVTTTEFTNYMKANDAILKNMQTNMTSLTNSNLELKNMFGQFMKINTASSSGSGTLLSNTITNPKEDLKGITTRSVPPTNNGSTKDVQPPVVQVETQLSNSEPVVAPVVEPVEAPEGELTLRVGNKVVTFILDQTSRYSSNYDVESIDRIDVIDVACEEYSQEVLGFSMSGNPTPSIEPIVSTSSPTLTPFGDSDFLLEETDAFLAIEDEPTSPEINDSYSDSEGDILLLEEFLNDDLLKIIDLS